jgi:hypothetical protein
MSASTTRDRFAAIKAAAFAATPGAIEAPKYAAMQAAYDLAEREWSSAIPELLDSFELAPYVSRYGREKVANLLEMFEGETLDILRAVPPTEDGAEQGE